MARKSRKTSTSQTTPQQSGMKVWKAALYVRLSVEFNSGRGDSLETQKQIMEANLALRPDIEIIETYVDNGTTGQHFEREGFQRMLCDVEAGKITCVVVKDLSRLGRNTIDTGYYIEKYFPLHQVRFIAVNDQYDSEDLDNSSNHVIVPLKNMVNEAYAADISRKVRAQAHQAMLDGEYLGARPVYGYLKDPNNCHKLIINEETAPTVRQIFEWTADGVPLNVVVKQLNEAGIITPGFYHASLGLTTNKRLVGSGKWQTRTILKILTDEIYMGDMVQGKHTNVHRKQIQASSENWIIVRNTHEAIVSRELFEAAQTIRRKAAEKAKSRVITPYTENILRGKIFCGCCGKNLHRQKAHGRYIFHCISNDRIEKGFCSGKIYLHEDALFGLILTIIQEQAEVVLGKSLQLKQQDKKVNERKKDTERELFELRRTVESNRKFLTSLYENLMNGTLTRQEYLDLKSGYESKITSAMDHMKELQEKQAELDRKLAHFFSLADRLAEARNDTALTSQLVNQVVDRITVNSNDDITVEFSFQHEFDHIGEVFGSE